MIYFTLAYIFLQGMLSHWNVDGTDFRVDDLGYVYGLDQQKITRYDRDGVKQFVYSRMDLGSLRQFDPSDPLRLLALFPETGTLVVLDNTLSEQRVLRLWDGGLGMPMWIASGVNQEFWVYDALNKEVVRIDERMRRTSSTGYLPAVTGHDPELVGLAERHEQLLVADKHYGIWIFDRFGTAVRSIPIAGIQGLQTHASGMAITTDDGLLWLRYGDFEPQKLDLPFVGGQVDADHKRLYHFVDGKLMIYPR